MNLFKTTLLGVMIAGLACANVSAMNSQEDFPAPSMHANAQNVNVNTVSHKAEALHLLGLSAVCIGGAFFWFYLSSIGIEYLMQNINEINSECLYKALSLLSYSAATGYFSLQGGIYSIGAFECLGTAIKHMIQQAIINDREQFLEWKELSSTKQS